MRRRIPDECDPEYEGESPVKAKSTVYTESRRASAQRNVERSAWARAQLEETVERARPFVQLADEDLWNLVTPQSVPRSYAVNQERGSPITGTDLFAYGRYPWQAEPLSRPWKLIDPSSGYVFPTNDFASYYASGIGPDGFFDPALADQQFLVNELYPERGPRWGVDDGFGWKDEHGNIWTFIAYYNHWWLWYEAPHASISIPVIWHALASLRDAYVLTDDLAYAHAGIILLDRVADVYPAMDTSRYDRAKGFLSSDGLRDRGGVVGSIWETDLVRQFLLAYDAFYPAMAREDVACVTPFLHAQASRYGQPNPKASVDDIRSNIENGIVRKVYHSVVAGRIRGNFGMHQNALALAAVVLDDPGTSNAWIEFLLQSGGYTPIPEMRATGGNVLATLVEDIDRDGFGDEAAPHYNHLWLVQMLGIASTLDDASQSPAADLYEHPRMRNMLDSWLRLTMIGAYTPTIGDTPKAGNPFLQGIVGHYVDAYARWGDPRYAQFAWLLNGRTANGLRGSILDDDPDAVSRKIQEEIEQHGPWRPGSDNLTGYGLAILRDDEPGHERDLWVYYGRNVDHGHADALNLGLHAHGIDLSPDLGYPEFADHNPKRLEWTTNTISHNTVTVDRQQQPPIHVGTPRDFVDTARVKLLDIDASNAYAQTETYRRISIMVRLGVGLSYVVDFFDVKGGTDHHFSFHGPEATVDTEGLDLRRQEGGSYAGDSVAWGPAPDARIAASGFSWLDNVERDTDPPHQFAVDWKAIDTWGVMPESADVHLRLTMMGQVDDVALADGYPSTNQPGNPDRLRYVLAHRQGEDLRSRFVSVLEPYDGQRAIRSIRQASVEVPGGYSSDDVAAVQIEMVDGRIDYVVSSRDPGMPVTVDGRLSLEGSVGVLSEVGGVPEYAFLSRGSRLGWDGTAIIDGEARALTGAIVGFTTGMSRQNQLEVTFDQTADVSRLLHAYIYIENDAERNAVYRILGAQATGSGTWTLDIGTASPIRRYADSDDFASGFVYDLAVGAACSIPLHHEWYARPDDAGPHTP